MAKRATANFYKKLGPKHVCAYCNAPEECLDHCVPVWLVRAQPASSRKGKLLAVASCAECNGMLSGKIFESFALRKQYLQQKYKKKYAKYLEIPVWDREEICDLEHNLQSLITASISLKRIIQRKLTFLADPMYPPEVPDDIWNVS